MRLLEAKVDFRILCLATLAVVACGKKGDSGADGGAGATVQGPIDPKILALAKKATGCKTYDTSFDSSCPDHKAWSDAKDDFNEGKADASLVGMLEDADEKIRVLGAEKLHQYGKTFKTDKALAERVVSAAEKEKAKFAGYEVGVTAGEVRVRETGLLDRVAAVVRKHDVSSVRRGVLSRFLSSNDDNDAVFAVVRDAVKDPEPEVAQAALSSFWGSGYKKPDDVCAVYLAHIDDANDNLASDANNSLSWSGRCSASYDALLDSLEKRSSTTGRFSSQSYSTSLRHICEDAKSSDAQHKRSATIARKVAEAKSGATAWIRAAALEAVVKCDPKLGPAFVGKFKADPEQAVKDKVKELLKPK